MERARGAAARVAQLERKELVVRLSLQSVPLMTRWSSCAVTEPAGSSERWRRALALLPPPPPAQTALDRLVSYTIRPCPLPIAASNRLSLLQGSGGPDGKSIRSTQAAGRAFRAGLSAHAGGLPRTRWRGDGTIATKGKGGPHEGGFTSGECIMGGWICRNGRQGTEGRRNCAEPALLSSLQVPDKALVDLGLGAVEQEAGDQGNGTQTQQPAGRRRK